MTIFLVFDTFLFLDFLTFFLSSRTFAIDTHYHFSRSDTIIKRHLCRPSFSGGFIFLLSAKNKCRLIDFAKQSENIGTKRCMILQFTRLRLNFATQLR